LNQPTKILSLKIPVALASLASAERHLVDKYQTNRFLKNITFFLILKAESPLGCIHDYEKQIDHLSFITQCERQTFRKRLAWCISEQLLEIKGSDIRLVSWKKVGERYMFALEAYKTIQYNPHEQKNIHLHLLAVEIEDNKNRQTYMIQQKLKKNPALTQVIKNTLHQYGADESKLNDFNYMLNAMRQLYKRSFEAEPEIHAMLNNVRPDVNRGVKGIAKAWDCKSMQTVSYWKKRLAEAGIIRIYKGEVKVREYLARATRTQKGGRKGKEVKTLVDTLYLIPQPGRPENEPREASKKIAA
jgi:hypothetical protein